MTDRAPRIVVLALGLGLVACRGGHHHGLSTNTNQNTLHVEIWTRGDHGGALRTAAAAARGEALTPGATPAAR